jgi:hypothetical protein
MSNVKPSGFRKRQLRADWVASASTAGELDIASCATIAFSSENPAYPVEYLFDGSSGPGATRWIGSRPDAIEHIVVEFDRPQTLSRLVYEVEEAERERTQEVRVEVSEDGGRSYCQILVQEDNFSPAGATYQREEHGLNFRQASHLRLRVWQGTLEELVAHPQYGISAWVRHVGGWLDHVDATASFTLLRYEDLRARTGGGADADDCSEQERLRHGDAYRCPSFPLAFYCSLK